MVTFEEGKVPLKKENNLIVRRDGPYKVVHKVRENAYMIDLLVDMQISANFNVGDLTSYLEGNEEHDEDLRRKPL